MRILVVEDEEDLANAIAKGLRKQGYAMDTALTAYSRTDKRTNGQRG